MKKRLFILIPMLALFILEGCVPSKPKEDEAVFPAERIVKKLEANRRKIKTFEGKGVINVISPRLEAKGNFTVTLKKPDSLKFSIYGPFGVELAHSVVGGRNFKFYDALKNKVYTGEVNDEVLQKMFKVDVSFDNLMDAFAGAVNLTEQLRKIPDQYVAAEDKFILSYIDSSKNRKSVYTVTEDNLAITEYLLNNLGGKTIFQGKYSMFREIEDVPVPYKIVVDNKDKGEKLEIEYRNIDVNNGNVSLELNVPSDAEKVRW